MRVVIVGIGETGLELANNLSRKKGSELVLIESDPDRCEELAEKLDALVLQGDGSDPDILRKAQLGEADALVALTGSDPINTVIAMLGKQLAVEKIIVKLNNVRLQSACHEIGVRAVIAPKIAAAAEIVSNLYGLNRINFASVASGGLRLEVFEPGRMTDKSLSELELPDGAHMVAVLQDQRMQIPRTSLKLQKQSELLILVEGDEVTDKIRGMLSDKEEAEESG